jgi:hypothetical protein
MKHFKEGARYKGFRTCGLETFSLRVQFSCLNRKCPSIEQPKESLIHITYSFELRYFLVIFLHANDSSSPPFNSFMSINILVHLTSQHYMQYESTSVFSTFHDLYNAGVPCL